MEKIIETLVVLAPGQTTLGVVTFTSREEAQETADAIGGIVETITTIVFESVKGY
jgi:hypothetical protein